MYIRDENIWLESKRNISNLFSCRPLPITASSPVSLIHLPWLLSVLELDKDIAGRAAFTPRWYVCVSVCVFSHSSVYRYLSFQKILQSIFGDAEHSSIFKLLKVRNSVLPIVFQ